MAQHTAQRAKTLGPLAHCWARWCPMYPSVTLKTPCAAAKLGRRPLEGRPPLPAAATTTFLRPHGQNFLLFTGVQRTASNDS
jgi:hypothetical protein